MSVLRRLLPLVLLLVLGAAAAAQTQPGEVVAFSKISATSGGFTGVLGADAFGQSLALLGDVDGDGIDDVAVGAHTDDGTGVNHGAVWILFLAADGSVKDQREIDDGPGGLPGQLDDEDLFGTGVAALGDLDGDGVPDLAVSADRDGDGGPLTGAVFVLFLDADGSVKASSKISASSGGFTGDLDPSDLFGSALAALGDVDGDGIVDLAVAAAGDDDGGPNRGAVWILHLDVDGTVKSSSKISQTSGGFGETLLDGGFFGSGLASGHDLDGDGTDDLAVGAAFDGETASERGAVWILFLGPGASVLGEQKINDVNGGFTGALSVKDRFGRSASWLGDLDGDGIGDLAVGATLDDDGVSPGGKDTGAVWLLFLRADGTVKAHQKISKLAGNFAGVIDDEDSFGASLLPLPGGAGDLALLVGGREDDDGTTNAGAVWRLELTAGLWTNLDGGVAGTAGLPVLTGTGTLLGGEVVTLELSGAAPASPATFVLGLSGLLAPFKGGVLVPAPDVVIGGLPTDGSGALALPFTWPLGVPAGVQLYYQYWLPDAAAPVGFASSNGLRSTTP